MLFLLFINLASLYAESSLSGAGLPYSNEWYRNPALQNRTSPAEVFSSPVSIPVGLIAALNPNTFPYELFRGEITGNTELDLLPLYIQLSNPLLWILNPPTSPDDVYFYISKESIEIRDGEGELIPISSIPGQDSYSIADTSLTPPPIMSFSFDLNNLFIGFGLFGGTSGLSVIFDENLTDILSQMEIEPGDDASLSIDFSARAGLFEYVNIVTDPIHIADEIELELAARIFIYQLLSEARASAMFNLEVDENYIYSGFENTYEMYYFYPGTGFGLGGRLDWGSVVTINDWTFGLSLLNFPGVEFSNGLKLENDAFIYDSSVYASIRPYILIHASYSAFLDNGLSIIPLADFGYGKTFFSHLALAVFWEDLCVKMGLAYENRLKASIGGGLRINKFSVESGITVQESVFSHTIAGFFISAGLDT